MAHALRLLLIALCLNLTVSGSSAVAAPPTPVDVLNYIINKKAQGLSRIGSHARSGPDGAGGYTIEDFDFEEGNNILAVAVKMLFEDLMATHLVDFYSEFFGNFEIIGLCCKKVVTCTAYIYYEQPYSMTEISGMHQSEYIPDLIMTLFRELNDLFWYDFAEITTPFEVGRLLGTFTAGDEPDLGRIAGMSDDMRLRVWGGQSNPFIRLQFQEVTPLAQLTPLLITPLGICHDRPQAAPFYRSDNPAFITMTNITGFSDILFPAEMGMMRLFPQVCTSHNIFKQVTSPVPFSLIAGAFEEKDYCLAGQGSAYPTATTIANSRSFGNASYAAFVRSNNLWRKMFPGQVHDFAMYKVGNRYQDYVQAHTPDYLPDNWTSKHDSYGDFRAGGYEGGTPEDEMDTSKHAVFTTIKRIRCCPFGSVKIGPRPQLRGMHAFPGG